MARRRSSGRRQIGRGQNHLRLYRSQQHGHLRPGMGNRRKPNGRHRRRRTGVHWRRGPGRCHLRVGRGFDQQRLINIISRLHRRRRRCLVIMLLSEKNRWLASKCAGGGFCWAAIGPSVDVGDSKRWGALPVFYMFRWLRNLNSWKFWISSVYIFLSCFVMV